MRGPFVLLRCLLHRLLPAARPLFVLIALLTPPAALAQSNSEHSVRAVLYYRLPQFIYWPNSDKPPQPLVLCVVGKTPLAAALTALAQDSPGYDIRLSPADTTACNLLFIARSEGPRLSAWLAGSEGRATLTVSDIPGFAQAGGMIELPLEGERVALVVNRKAAQKQNLDFNAQLLRLARVVAP